MKTLSLKTIAMYLAGMAITICLYSCQKNFDDLAYKLDGKLVGISADEYLSVVYDDPRELTVEEIEKIAVNYPLLKKPGTKGLNSKINKIERYYLDGKGISQSPSEVVRTKGLSENSIPLYNVEINVGGKFSTVLLSADERIPGVLSYKDGGNSKDAENLMLENAKSYLRQRIKYLNHLKDSLRTKTLIKLQSQLGRLPSRDLATFIKNKIKITDALPKTKSLVEYYLWGQVLTQVGPFATTEWEQDGVFKQGIPSANGCAQASAGCLVIAGAQVLATIEPPMSVVTGTYVYPPTMELRFITEAVDWPYLKETPYIGTNAPAQKKKITERLINHVFTQSYSTPLCDGSSTELPKMITFLRRYIDIDDPQTFNVQQIKNSLDNSHNVLVTGIRQSGSQQIGHAWVVDGYAICQKPGGTGTGDLVNQYDLYLHANMGWGGAETGWFLVGTDWNLSFDVAFGDRQYGIDLRMATNARSK